MSIFFWLLFFSTKKRCRCVFPLHVTERTFFHLFLRVGLLSLVAEAQGPESLSVCQLNCQVKTHQLGSWKTWLLKSSHFMCQCLCNLHNNQLSHTAKRLGKPCQSPPAPCIWKTVPQWPSELLHHLNVKPQRTKWDKSDPTLNASQRRPTDEAAWICVPSVAL